MAEIADAWVALKPSAKGFGRATESQIGGEMRTSGSRIGGLFGTAIKTGAVAGAVAVGAAFTVGLKGAAAYQKLQAQTAAVLKSTGGAAGVTADGITKLAGKIAAYSDGNDDAVQSGANLLLTFTNIKNEAGRGNKIFDQTTKIMYDMSTALGQDTSSSALQLGKALNDPVKGITALSRVGVSFTQGQKDQIKTLVESGRTMDAQKVILKELNKEFGGSAKAVGQTFAGSMGRLKDSFEDLLRDAVIPLLPYLTRFADYLTANLPGAIVKIKSTISAVIDFVRPFAVALSDVFGKVRAGLDGLGGGGGVSSLRDTLGQLATYIQTNIVPAFMNVVTAVRGFISGVLPIVQQFVAGMQERLAPLLPKVQEVFRQIGSTITDALNLIAAVIGVVLTAIQFVWRNFGDVIMGYVAGVFSSIVTAIQGALNIIQGVIRLVMALIKGDWSGAWDAIKQILQGAWQVIQGVVSAALNTLKALLGTAWVVIKGAAKAAWDGIKKIPSLALVAAKALVTAEINGIKAILTAAWNNIKAVTSAVWNAIKSVVSTQIAGMKAAIGGIAGLVGKVRGWFSDILSAIKTKLGQAVDFVKGIPGKVTAALSGLYEIGKHAAEQLISGLVDTIRAKVADVKNAISSVAGAIKDHFPGSPVKTGPLTSWNNGGAGKRLMGMLTKGIADAGPGASDAAKKVADGIRSRFEALRDQLKSTLDGLKSDFSSLKDSIASTFTGNLFDAAATSIDLGNGLTAIGQTAAQAFQNNLLAAQGNLRGLLAAFKKLKGWGIPAQFLSQLFASGNGGLILELASGSRGQARADAALFGNVQSLSNQLGAKVARNDLGPKIDRTNKRLEQIEAAIKRIGKDVGREVSGASAAGHRGRVVA